MFETSNGRSGAQVNRALVAMTFQDGTATTASVRLPLSGKIADGLNNADRFLDILTMEGDQLFVAKSSIRNLHLVDVPRASQLNMYRRASDRAAFNPYAVLKIAKGAAPEDIRKAYHALARTYHHDRLAAYELPGEMQEYARVMLVRINLAYEQVGG